MPSLHVRYVSGNRLLQLYIHMILPELFKRVPFVLIALSLITGLLMGSAKIPILLILILGALGIVLLLFQNDQYFVWGICLSIIGIGGTYISFHYSSVNERRDVAHYLNDEIISFISPVYEIRSTEKGRKFRIELKDFEDIGVWFFTKENIVIEIGDTLKGQGTFQKITGPRNPGEFNFQDHFYRQGIYGWIFDDKEKNIEIYNRSSFSFDLFIDQVRNKIRTHFRNLTPGVGGDLLSALILGDKSDVDVKIREDFAETGVIHVLAVSGLHVGYVLIILLIIKNMFRLPWGWDRIVVVVGLFLFVILTGSKASVVRASIMAGLYVLAPVINRQVNIWNIIAAAAFLILCIKPLSLFDLGFQLSFSAVISIVFFYNWLNLHLPDRFKVQSIENKNIQFIWSLFLVSFSAQIGTLPLTSHYFGKIPIIAFIANVLIVPLIGLLVGVGFFILFFGWIPVLGPALGESAWLLAKVITGATDLFSEFSFSSINVQFSYVDIFLFFLFIISILLFFSNKRTFSFLIVLCFINIIVWQWSIKDQYLDIIYLDVGQGDAVIIRLPDGETMLIDAGQRNRHENMGEEVVLPVLEHLNIHKMDWVVMSHPHSDHIGGLISIKDQIVINNIIDTFVQYDSWTYNTIIENALMNEVNISRFKKGDALSISKNALISFFAPDSQFAVLGHNVNNASIVFKLTYGESSFLFTGDLEHEGDELLIPFGDHLQSDVLKVAHHGSITSSTNELLDFVKPQIAVISVGKNNKYNHPSKEVMQRLTDRQVDIHRTDLQGALWLRSNGKRIWEVVWQ